MKLSKIFPIFILVSLLTLPSADYALCKTKTNRIALVIGNGTYQDSPLKNPEKDAKDIALALNDLGFDVDLRTNINKKVMKSSIHDFGKRLRSGKVGLFYFAGHGVQSKGENYLIPVEADIHSNADVEFESVNVRMVLSHMGEMEDRLNIVILDACRSNALFRGESHNPTEVGLAKMSTPNGFILAYAALPGEPVLDGVGPNGLYTSMLLKHIHEPDIPIETFFKKVRVDVTKEAKKFGFKQIPCETSVLTGDFYFNQTSSSVARLNNEDASHQRLNKKDEVELDNNSDNPSGADSDIVNDLSIFDNTNGVWISLSNYKIFDPQDDGFKIVNKGARFKEKYIVNPSSKPSDGNLNDYIRVEAGKKGGWFYAPKRIAKSIQITKSIQEKNTYILSVPLKNNQSSTSSSSQPSRGNDSVNEGYNK